MQRYRPQLAWFVLFALVSFAPVVRAQTNPQQLAEINRQAMEAYTNLDVEQARAALEKAVQKAEKANVRGPALARTLANLAVVFVGGLGDEAGAVALFERALKEDPKVEPDPIVATPEVMAAFNAAKARVGKSAAPEPRRGSGPRRAATPSFEGNLDHTPAPEQLSQTAVPVFVRKSPDLDISKIKLSYRSLGMKKPKTVELAESDDGFTFLIPCTDVFEPTVEYFIIAVDGRGKTVGHAGSSANPIAVPIVRTRSQPAPSLPGQLPPAQCGADDECPPGMPGCRSGHAGMGDTCSVDNDCKSGLVCDDNFCVSGERSDEESSSRKSSVKRFFVDLNFGVGATRINPGRAPDRKPPIGTIDTQSRNENDVLDLDKAEQLLINRGFDCRADQTEDNGLLLSNCTVAVKRKGMVAVPIVNVAAGYFITPKLALGITGRFQLARGEGPLAGILLGVRADYLFLVPQPTGLRVGLLAGFTVGQMQARPLPGKDGAPKGPYATNANIGQVGTAVTLGLRASYRFLPNLGVNITPALQFGLPNFLFAFDATGGVEVAF